SLIRFYKTWSWVKKLLPGYTWHKSRTEKVLYLTFDDGPIPVVTPFVLEQLKAFNAKATFFCVGDNLAKNADIAEQAIKEGHVVSNHTYNHLKGWQTPTNRYIQNTTLCEEELLKLNI